MKFSNLAISKRLPIRLVLIGATFIAAGRMPVSAQDQPSQTPDMQQMQRRLEQLENEVQELRRQMNAAAATQAAQPARTGGYDVNQPVTFPEQNPQTTDKPEKPKTGSSVDIYGFVMTDSGYNFGVIDPDWFDVVRPTKLPAYPGEFGSNGNTYFGVRQTRFGVKTFTPTPAGNLKTIFEFELFGTGVDAGQTTFRLRHAWGEIGHFGAGQSWSPFMDIGVFPDSIEYWGPNGMAFFRNVQVRWTPVEKGDSNVQIALERPGASADGGIYATRIELSTVVPHFQWPDLSGHVKYAGPWGYVQAAGIVRKMAWVDTGTGPFNLSGSAVGAGANLSSNLKITKNDLGKFSVVYGHGIENYMNDAPIDVGAKNNFGNPTTPIKGVPLPVFGLVAFVDHKWSSRYFTSAGYSMLNITNSNAQTPSDFHRGQYGLANLLYRPVPTVTMGGEFQFGQRQNVSNGYTYNDYRIQFSFRYDWAKGFEF
jgi:hypothetical protein